MTTVAPERSSEVQVQETSIPDLKSLLPDTKFNEGPIAGGRRIAEEALPIQPGAIPAVT